MTEWKTAQEEFACEHEQTEYRQLTECGGRKVWVKQCLRCGSNCGSVKRELVPGLVRLKAPQFDEILRVSWQADRSARYDELKAQSKEEWLREHSSYLETAQWANRRALVLRRDGGICQGCGVNLATQVHHLTYRRWQREMLFDLVSVCKRCHDLITKWDREAQNEASEGHEVNED